MYATKNFAKGNVVLQERFCKGFYAIKSLYKNFGNFFCIHILNNSKCCL